MAGVISKLINIFESEPIDWKLFDEILLSLDDINQFDECAEETLLSDLLNGFWDSGKYLADMVSHFISCGYDVKANGGKNGEYALKALCYSSGDRYILEAAKLLLAAGTPLLNKCDEDDDVIDAIGSHLLGLWNIHYFCEEANIFEAYRHIIEAYTSVKDYNSIDSFHACIGKKLTSVSAIKDENRNIIERTGEIHKFHEPIILWFENQPLVVNAYIEFVKDPVYAADNVAGLTDISNLFDDVLGAEFMRLFYIDPVTCCMEFDNGLRVLFTDRKSSGNEYTGCFEICRAEPEKTLTELDINYFCRRKGSSYSNTNAVYESPAVAIFCTDGVYLLYLEQNEDCEDDEEEQTDYEFNRFRLLKCSEAFAYEFGRRFVLDKPDNAEIYCKDENVVGVRFRIGNDWLYFRSQDMRHMDIMLSDDEIDLCRYKNFCSFKGKKINFALAPKCE